MSSARPVTLTIANCIITMLLPLMVLGGCSLREPTPLEQASAQFMLGHWDEAITLCNRLIDEQPQNADAWLLRGRCYLGKDLPDHAVQDYSEAIRLRPGDPEALYHRAIAYQQLGNVELATADHDRARELDVEAKKAGALRYSRSYGPQWDAEDRPQRSPPLATDKPTPKEDSTSDIDVLTNGEDDPLHQLNADDLASGQWPPERTDQEGARPPKSPVKPNAPVTSNIWAGRPATNRGQQSALPSPVSSASDHFRQQQTMRLDSTFGDPHAWLDDGGLMGQQALPQTVADETARNAENPPRPHEKGGEADQRDSDTGDQPDEPSLPRLPSGTFVLPQHITGSTPITGFPYSATGGMDPRPAFGRSSSQLYSLPGSGPISAPDFDTHAPTPTLAPNPLIPFGHPFLPDWQATGAGPSTIWQTGTRTPRASLPTATGGTRSATMGTAQRPFSTAPAQAVPPTTLPANTNWQNVVPFPQEKTPTTGFVDVDEYLEY
jgi:hypothetical protein